MGISFPTHQIRASESQFDKKGTVLKKNTTDITVFLEASSYGNLVLGLPILSLDFRFEYTKLM